MIFYNSILAGQTSISEPQYFPNVNNEPSGTLGDSRNLKNKNRGSLVKYGGAVEI